MKTILQKKLLALLFCVAAYTGVNAQCATSTILSNQGNGLVNVQNQSSFPAFYSSYVVIDYGDGSSYSGSGTSFNTVHSYTSNGIYLVQTWMNSFDPMDSTNYCSNTDVDTVVITGLVPTCNLQASVYAYNTGGLSATIWGMSNNTYTSSYIMVDGQVYYNVDSVNYTFPTAGSYNVCYYVEDSSFLPSYCYDSTCIIYNTNGGGPVGGCNAYFYMYQDSLTPGLWYGVDMSSGSGPLTYAWDFGDGTASNLPYPTHTYAAPGNYVICLTITDSLGTCTSTYCDSSAAFRLSTSSLISTFQVTAPTGIKESIHAVSEVKLFPNPMADLSSLQFSSDIAAKGRIEVVGVLGNIVLSENVSIAKGANEFKLNTAALANGVYYINILGDNRMLSSVKAVK